MHLKLIILGLMLRLGHGEDQPSDKCQFSRTKYDFVIGTLSTRGDDGPHQFNKIFLDYSRPVDNMAHVKACFNTNSYVSLLVEEDLFMPTAGWTNVTTGIAKAIENQQNSKKESGLSVVVGPFYMNLAMILENLKIPYVVTDYMGYNWTDINRVDDHIPWKYVVNVRPPIAEFNSAIVDFFVSQKWESAVVIMPESPTQNQICQNLARQMVENKISPISYSLALKDEESMRRDTYEVLRMVQLLEQRKIVICSPREDKYKLIHIVLSEAQFFRMMDNEAFSFFALDPSTRLEPFDEINMYRNRLVAAKCGLFAFRYKEITNTTDHFKSGYAWGAADAAVIIREAKFTYLMKQKSYEDEFSRERYTKELKDVYLFGRETGDIKFNSSGSRVNYTLVLYNHGGGSSKIYKKVATWQKSDGAINAQTNTTKPRLTILDDSNGDDEKTKLYGIFDSVAKVVVVLEEPFIMKRQSPDSYEGNAQYEGFTIDLLNRLSEEMNFKYEIVLSPENMYGSEDPNTGQWGGIVGEIISGNATLGMGAISITSKRQRVIDFSLGVISTGVNILITKPEEIFNIFQFLTPFSLELWMAIIGSSIGVSIIFYILDYRSRERMFTVKSTLWFSVGTLLMKGSEFAPKKTSQRILTIGFLFFVLITVSTYTANMAAFLTKKNLQEPVNTFEALANRDDYKIVTVEHSATENFFRSAEDLVFSRIYKKMETVPNATQGRLLVEKGDTAFIFDYMINSFSEKKYCKTRSVSTPILLQEHGIAIKQGAPFKSQLNIELLRLKEEGFIQTLKKKWWENKRTCDENSQNRVSTQVEFKIEHTAGVFIVAGFGLAASATLFLLKKFYVYMRGNVPARADTNSDGASSSKSHDEKSRDPLIYGLPEGKQSTV